MTDNNHPITPPPELVQQWLVNYFGCIVNGELSDSEKYLATQAARWGADQELEACVEWMGDSPVIWRGDPEEHPGFYLREARRPKPPSLKAQALEALKHTEEGWRPVPADCEIIRRALESLPD